MRTEETQDELHEEFMRDYRFAQAHGDLTQAIDSLTAALRFMEFSVLRQPELERALAQAAMQVANMTRACVTTVIKAVGTASMEESC